MPTLHDLSESSSEVNLNEVVCQFAFTMEDHGIVYGFIGKQKFHKHILAVNLESLVHAPRNKLEDWEPVGFINPKGKTHTAIAPTSFGTIRPLYEFSLKISSANFERRVGKIRT